MSRSLRIQYPGAIYHVMNRGNAHDLIFKRPDHYRLFLRCLSETIDMWKTKLQAFTLLPNHYHLLLETPLGNISRAMRHLNHVCTQRYNKMLSELGQDLKDPNSLKYIPEHVNAISEKSLQRILCHRMDIKWNSVTNPVGRKEQQNRARVIWFYRRYLKKTYSDLSRQFGVSPSRISMIMKDKDFIESELVELVDMYLKSEK